MSIQGEIDRLSAAKASIAASLQAMGIEPPEGTTLEQYAAQLAAIATAAPWLSIPGGGTMQMGESLGAGPYTIEVTEDEDSDLSAAQVGYNNEGTGITATNVQDAVTELFTSVSEGKAAIAAAITDKGVATAADATFQQMAEKIGEIASESPPENITTSLTFDLSKMTWNVRYRSLEDGEVVTKSGGNSPAELSNIKVLKGTPITVLVNRNGAFVNYEGDGDYYVMASSSGADIYVMYPTDKGTGRFYST